ncbi:unnamed protein product [Blepharisma stoltei]|uniref:Macro domain-containing protein n=1 Tax=Blepharisma stoltei TaxID=1481888 RepID=A0AAU9KC99_9CILI|nr:unnamed protein product [Blepharisma stoltei]
MFGLFGKKKPKVLREFTHGTTKLQIVRNSISKENVGAIVNITNATLDQPDGVAKEIISSGSHQMLLDCRKWVLDNGQLAPGHIAVTPGGKLAAIHIIHLSSPSYQRSLPGQDAALRELIWSCLAKGEELGINSIALPAFCIGSFGYPLDLVVPVMLNTVQQYLLSHEDTKYNLIRFTNQDKSIYEVFVSEFERRWPDSIPQSKKKAKKSRQLASSLTPGMDRLVEREIERQRVSSPKPQKAKAKPSKKKNDKNEQDIELKDGVNLEALRNVAFKEDRK